MTYLITPKTKHEILKITDFLASQFRNRYETDLLSICKEEGIKLIVDNYQHYFDGMLVWDSRDFNIHLNSSKGNQPDTRRGRFTLSHELGHYFIEAHSYAIRNDKIKPHPSKVGLFHHKKMEAEADYFASCLLMPREKFRAFTGSKRTFSLDVIKEVSEAFNVSLTAALIRFVEVGTHGVLVVFCENGKIKWYSKSDDFPFLSHRFKIGDPPPPTSVLGEAFLKNDAKYTTVQNIDLEDWFFDRKGAPTWPLFEQCFYSDIYRYAISVVWFK